MEEEITSNVQPKETDDHSPTESLAIMLGSTPAFINCPIKALPKLQHYHFGNTSISKSQIKKDSFHQSQLIFQDHSNLLLSILLDHFHKLLAATLLKSKLLLLSPLPSPWKTTTTKNYLQFFHSFKKLKKSEKHEKQLFTMGLFTQALTTDPASNPQ
ncbi:hypothetical protein CEXT_265201 [Caerostris extrusa]|uniref:Uncharacterized protein n=1 Tax=Caerostris extrusa TaxID=172846 RepID=A0AAV4N7X2_CAEEX|nr:hypothetical protein CEXT_265201 [Caerostris extrusa]